MEGSPRLHPCSELQGIQRRGIKHSVESWGKGQMVADVGRNPLWGGYKATQPPV
jgi:hypothetical protein